MVADTAKKPKIADQIEEDDSDNNIDGELVLSIEKLQEIQDDLEKVNEEASDKVLEVEQKYHELRRPVYARRAEITKAIPDFWLTAFMSHPALGDLLNEEDQKIFKHLASLEVEEFKDVKSGYSITFNFDPNPYFEDVKLTKMFNFSDEGWTNITSTNIKWKVEKDIANGDHKEKKGGKRPFGDDSFFSWFNEIQHYDLLDGFHDEVAEIIREDLWSNPLRYFNNEAEEDDFDGDEDDEEGKGSGDNDDELDGDEDED
ncbi:hypothetical protein Scep_021802 [Stephania cephalantha]|uniref:Uncharacterized protein n=1 Tax=Stephania cephalantha TaxID=152367 RepID=A0AAP0F979_9MAGN